MGSGPPLGVRHSAPSSWSPSKEARGLGGLNATGDLPLDHVAPRSARGSPGRAGTALSMTAVYLIERDQEVPYTDGLRERVALDLDRYVSVRHRALCWPILVAFILGGQKTTLSLVIHNLLPAVLTL